MNIPQDAPAYILGQSPAAEHRLGLLDELTCPQFIDALGALPKRKVQVLVMGCGSGHLEARLSKIFFESHFICIDISSKRIEEAKTRMEDLKNDNSFEFIQGDLTTMPLSGFRNVEILISRFVLSHLKEPQDTLNRFLPLVRPGGFICFEELASDGSEFYCNKDHEGYRKFVDLTKLQISLQQCSFMTGFELLEEMSNYPAKVLHTHLTQAVLRTARHKAILRLGIEDGKSMLLERFDEKQLDELILSLVIFEEDPQAFGLYARSLAVVARISK